MSENIIVRVRERWLFVACELPDSELFKAAIASDDTVTTTSGKVLSVSLPTFCQSESRVGIAKGFDKARSRLN